MTVEENVNKKIWVIKEKDPKINAFIDTFESEALERAKIIDKKIKNGKAGKLAGLIFGVKNNIAIKGKRLTCSSRILEGYVAPYNATVIERILKEDGIIIGTTNMDEFAAGSDTTHSAFFKTKNPIDLERVPGGSSGGPAAAVAAEMCDVALGSDTGGSIRCPAAFCGVVGFKPTYGAVSRYGLVDMAMSLDQIGPISKDVKTAKLVYDIIKGKDPKDQTTLSFEEKTNKNGGIKSGIKIIGIPKEFFDGVDEKISGLIKKKIKEIEGKGFQLMDVSIPSLKYSIPIYYLLMAAEFSSGMQKYDGLRYGVASDRTLELYQSFSEVRGQFLGKEVKRRILLGTYITMKEFKEEWYTQTLRGRKLMQNEFNAVLKKCDALIGPAMPIFPWKFGEKLDPIEMYAADILTVSANLIGLPAGVIPIGEINNLPVALQIHGKKFEDNAVLEMMKEIR